MARQEQSKTYLERNEIGKLNDMKSPKSDYQKSEQAHIPLTSESTRRNKAARLFFKMGLPDGGGMMLIGWSILPFLGIQTNGIHIRNTKPCFSYEPIWLLNNFPPPKPLETF